MKFTHRQDELVIIKRVLSYSPVTPSVYFELSGGSGTGKTELIKEAVEQIVNSETYIVYIDIVDDEFQANSLFASLIENVYFPMCHRRANVTNISTELALSKYIKKILKRQKGFKNVIESLAFSTSVFPYVGEAISSLSDKLMFNDYCSVENLLFAYIKCIIKKTRINIIVDNYQFLPNTIKRAFECGINEFSNGITLVTINRLSASYVKQENFCWSFRYDSLCLQYMQENLCIKLIQEQNIPLSDIQLKQIWEVSKGNLKDIEIILNELRINPGYNIINNRIAIQNLDNIQRNILIITALFPAGMKEDYIISFIRNIFNETEESKIKNKIMGLVNLGYIYINSETNDTIKPTHETIIINVRKAIEQQDFIYIQNILSESIEQLALNYHGTRDYAYLLHCWVGISNAEILRQRSSYLQDLISIKYKENAYFYIDAIVIQIRETIPYLPENIIYKILVSFQRVSNFANGIDLLNELRITNMDIYLQFEIFYAKFLVQTYEFEDTLEILKKMPNSSEKILCETNALQHLGRDDTVYRLLKEQLPFCERDEHYYIILRNTAHYFVFEEADKNLKEALAFFEMQKHAEFAVATIRNNLGVINIWNGRHATAIEYLGKAVTSLKNLESNEIFEPYCNMSVVNIISKNFEQAQFFAKLALENCPTTLSLDILMLKIHLCIIKILKKEYNIQEALDELNYLSVQYQNIEDPWYEFQLRYNQMQLANKISEHYEPLKTYHKKYITEYSSATTKFYILHDFDLRGKIVSLCLGLSPNWRY